jgi:hypothetical protein
MPVEIRYEKSGFQIIKFMTAFEFFYFFMIPSMVVHANEVTQYQRMAIFR